MRKIKTGDVELSPDEFKSCRVQIDEEEYLYLKRLASWVETSAIPAMDDFVRDAPEIPGIPLTMYLKLRNALAELPLPKDEDARL